MNTKKRLALVISVTMVVLSVFSFISNDRVSAATTLTWPVPGHYDKSRGFWYKNDNDCHVGLDILGTGADVVSACNGTVYKIYTCTNELEYKYGPNHISEPTCHGFGTGIVIRGDDNRSYVYGHMRANSIPSGIGVGSRVSAGQKIGVVGQTGNCDGPHLHFQINNDAYDYWTKSKAVNPMNETYSGGSIPLSVSWSGYSNQEIREGKVVLAKTATLSGASMNDVSIVGIDVYNSSNSLVKSKEENPDRSGYSYVNMWYDLSSELGLSITPGTVYKYSFWVKIGGKKYESTRETVTCPPVYIVKFDAQGGSSVSQMTVGKNQTISILPTSTLDGYKLDGWYTSQTGGTKLTTSTKITGNITYYAHWINAEDPNTRIALNSTNFPDPVFREYISDTYDTNNTGYLSQEEVLSITTLRITDKSITSLKGIEFFTALTELDAKNNSIDSIDISKNINLTSVNLLNNQISNINLLNNYNLVSLNLSKNNLTSIDLSNNTKLGCLWLGSNQLTSLDLSNNTNLWELVISDNKINSINLSGVTNLSNFYCHRNPINIIDIRNMSIILNVYENGGKYSQDDFVRYYKGQMAYNFCIDKDDVVITGNESFSVVLTDISNGTASLSKTSASYEDEITVATTPAIGYTLDKITVNGTAISGNKFKMPASDTTVEVTFKKITYSVSISSVSNGTASLSKTSANYGDEITVSTSPETGYTLDKITVNGTEISGNKFTMPAKNTTVEVVFKSSFSITEQPSSFTGIVGSTAKFSVVAVGEGLTYQWQLKKGKSWVNLSSGGATTSTMFIKIDASKNGKIYRCLITNADGEEFVTNEVSIAIKESSIKIITQPSDFIGTEGSTAKFSVVAEGEGLTYQWQLKKGKIWANLSSGGATTSTMSINLDASKNGKVYRCFITSADGEELATNEVSITLKEPSITITEQPVDYVGAIGITTKFSVTAEGENLTYQWQLKKGKSWANLSSGGATTSAMSIKVDDSKNGKVYRCLITNSAGEVLASNEVSITVKDPAITIVNQPSDYSGVLESKAKFKVVAEGESLTYQWQLKKGSSWADLSSGGAKTSEMTIKIDASKNGKVYRCVITNADGEQIATNEVTIMVVTAIDTVETSTAPLAAQEPTIETVPELVEGTTESIPAPGSAPVKVSESAEVEEAAVFAG